MRISVLGGIILLALTAGAQAKVYKWVDAQGRVHYSANPPAQRTAQEVKVKPAPPSAQATQAEADKPGADDDKATAGSEKSQADAARAEAFRKNCEIAQQNLKILEDPANRRFNEAGKDEPIYYTDEQRAAKVAETQKSIDTYCNGPQNAAKK